MKKRKIEDDDKKYLQKMWLISVYLNSKDMDGLYRLSLSLPWEM